MTPPRGPLSQAELEADYRPEPDAGPKATCRRCGWEPVVGPLYDDSYSEPPTDYRCYCGAIVTKTVPEVAYTTDGKPRKEPA